MMRARAYFLVRQEATPAQANRKSIIDAIAWEGGCHRNEKEYNQKTAAICQQNTKKLATFR
jgi:hypothetical protein